MEIKPVAERTNWPLIAAFIVWLIGIAAMGFSSTLYFTLTFAAIALFLCQIALNVRVRRAKA